MWNELPSVPMSQLLGGQAPGEFEVRALGVGDRKEPGLGVVVERDAQQIGGLSDRKSVV